MAITYFGSASLPTTHGGNIPSPTVITPPSSMSSGDLVVVACCNRIQDDTQAVSEDGGQTWTALSTYSGGSTTCTVTWFWCTFNGTWSANPSWSHGGTNNTCMMLVFRPTSELTWEVDVS